MKLEDAEIIAWSLFVSSLFLRSRKWRQQMLEPQIVRLMDTLCSENSIKLTQYKLSIIGNFVSLATIKKAASDCIREALRQPSYFHLSNIESSIMKLALLLLSKHWTAVQASERMQFITKDSPVSSFRLDERGAIYSAHGFGKPDVVACLPISPDRIWLANPTPLAWPTRFSPEDHSLFNRLFASFGQKMLISLNDEQSACDLAKRDLDSTVFGVSAFLTPSVG
jgi:hypothetical protein